MSVTLSLLQVLSILAFDSASTVLIVTAHSRVHRGCTDLPLWLTGNWRGSLHIPIVMDAAAAEQAVTPRYPFRGILLFKDSDAHWLSSVSDSNQDVARIDANVLLSRRDREFYGDNVQPGLVVILSRPDDSDECVNPCIYILN